MGLRQLIEKNRKVAAAVAVVVIVFGAWVAISQTRSMFSSNLPNGAFYTVDDGATWFHDDYAKAPPFDVGGKQAVRAYVVECDGKEKVAFLSRYNDKAKKAIEQFQVARASGKPIDAELGKGMGMARMSGMEYKRPGDTKWVAQANAGEVAQIRSPKCSDGSAAVEVAP